MERFSFSYLKLIFQKNSLTRRFVFSLAMVLILFAFLASGLSYYYTSIALRQEVEHEAEAHLRTITSVIAKPLAERDLETLHTVSNTYLSHHLIEVISIKDQNKNQAIKITASPSDATKMIKTATIDFQGEPLGEVTIIFSLKELEDYLQRLALISLATFILAALVIFATATFLLNHFLQTPLADLQRQMQAIANFQKPDSLVERIAPELQPLLHSMHAAADTIRQREEELVEQHSLLRTLIEYIPDGIYAMDAQGRKILSNRADLLNMGAQFEFEVLGKTDLEWYGEAGKQYYEDDMYVIRSGVPIVNKEEHAVSKRGRQRWVLTTKLPLRDAQGQIIGLVGIGRDITEQKLANQALKESERLFRQLLDLIPHYISIKDREGKFIIVNSALAQSVEMTPEELRGRSLLDVAMDQAEARFMLENDQQVIAEGIIQTFTDQTYTDRFGIIHWLEVTKVPIEVRGKTAVLEIGIDVTNYKLTEAALRESETRYRLLNEELEKRVQDRTAQLQAANQELESFSYSVSHDLRAPLRTIDGFSLALLEDYAEQLDEQGRYYLQRIRSASQRMAALIDDLLMLSRVTRAEMQIATINLSQIARSIIEEWQAEQPSRKVTFIAPPEIIVQADLNLMRILLTNLLGNAWKFTSKHPSATIELGELWQDGQRIIFVRDDGAGFDMAYADRLFTAFQRLHKESEFEGTGIGLATVQRIIFRHGGKIWVYSEVERGTTFFFVLPH